MELVKPSVKCVHLAEGMETRDMRLRDREIVYSETGSYTIHPSLTIEMAEKVLETIGVEKVEQINSEFTDGVPIFRLNEAKGKAKCHRQACQWSLPPTALNNPPRESFGKGMTVEQSKASAMMEAVERYCGQRFPHSKVISERYEEVKNDAIHPSEFKMPSLPLKCVGCAAKDKECFQELLNASEEWCWGYSLINKRAVLVPSALVYYPYISANRISFIFNDTGGLSSGNILEEAILQGIAEIIERDALYYAFNLGNLERMPMIDIRRIDNEYVKQFTIRLSPESIFAFSIKNENLNFDITTFSAFLCYRTGNERRFFGGSGTSLDPGVGLLRALTELEQQKVRQKAFFKYDPNDLISHNGAKSGNAVSIEKIPKQSTANIKSDIDVYLDKLSKYGTDVIVVDLTHPEIGIPVVRVLIPKLISYSGDPIRESVLLDSIEAFGGSY